jgi:hypothetical protein
MEYLQVILDVFTLDALLHQTFCLSRRLVRIRFVILDFVTLYVLSPYLLSLYVLSVRRFVIMRSVVIRFVVICFVTESRTVLSSDGAGAILNLVAHISSLKVVARILKLVAYTS